MVDDDHLHSGIQWVSFTQLISPPNYIETCIPRALFKASCKRFVQLPATTEAWLYLPYVLGEDKNKAAVTPSHHSQSPGSALIATVTSQRDSQNRA